MPSSSNTQRFGGLEVRVGDREHIVGALLVDAPHHRVGLPDEQPSARPQQVGDRLRPPADVRQPAKGADTGVDEVEPPAPSTDTASYTFGLDVIHLRTGQRRYPPRFGQRCG